MDLLQRRDNKQLQVELSEELESVLSRLIGTAPEGLINHHEAERARAHRTPFEAELVGKACRQHSVGELFLLPARLAP